MTTRSVPTIYESFNARFLDPAQVAATFAPPDHFERLVRRNHAIVVGPRGSGKTTLLKMLQQPALEAWMHPLADEYRARIDYSGVFIPSDVAWTRQLLTLGEGQLGDQDVRLFATAAFTSHVLGSLVTSFLDRTKTRIAESRVPHRRVSLDPDREAELVRSLMSSWHIAPRIPTLAALRLALRERMAQVKLLASQEAQRAVDGRNERIANVELLHLDFLSCVSLGIEAFNHYADDDYGRWALLFDELEIVPAWLQQRLIDALRSTDERLLFKLSLSPFTREAARMRDALAGAPDNDYEEISLWYVEKWEGHSFCDALWNSMIERRGIRADRASTVLGYSAFATPSSSWREHGTAYGPRSWNMKLLRKAEDMDATFRQYLQCQSINLADPTTLTPNERAATLRKVTPPLVVRQAYRREHPGDSRQVRTRKLPTIYAGVPTVFEITEGNPRWFIGLASRLLDTVRDRDNPKVTKAVQAREIRNMSNRFRAMLRTMPGSDNTTHRARGLLSLLNDVGQFIFDAVVRGEFTPDPAGSIIVDSRTSPDTLEALEGALNAGALVYVPDQDSGVRLLSSLRGKRFRLSYLLAPSYGIPIRLGRERALSAMIDSRIKQREMFDDTSQSDGSLSR